MKPDEEVKQYLLRDMTRFPERADTIPKGTISVIEASKGDKKIPMVKDIAQMNYTEETGVVPVHPLSIMTAIAEDSIWVQRAVNVIASACTSTTPLYRINNNAKKSYKDKRQAQIDKIEAVLKRPNLQQGRYEFFRTIFENLVLYGNAFVQIIKNRKGEIHSMYTLPPETMRVIPYFDADRILHCGYIQVDNAMKPMTVFLEDEMIHFKTPNPKSFLYGKPIFYPMLVQVAISLNAEKSVASWFERGFVGGAVFEMDVNEDAAARNRQFLQEEYTKPENFGSILLLEGGVKMVSDGNKFIGNLDFKALNDTGRDNILQGAGVPLSQAGVRSDSGQANIEVITSEEKAFLRNTVGPFQNFVFERLNQWLFAHILGLDDVEIESGIPDRFSMKDQIEIVKTLSDFGVTPNEVRDLLSMQRVPDEEAGNVHLISTNNGTVKAQDILGLNLTTGEESESMFDLQQKAEALKAGASGTGGAMKKALEGK